MKKQSIIFAFLFVLLMPACRPDPLAEMVSQMSLRDKVAQTIVPQHYNPDIDSLVAVDHIGGVIVMVSTKAEVDTLLPRLQAESQIPLFTSIDAEWGASMRMWDDFPRHPKAGEIAKGPNPDSLAYEVGRAAALELRSMGIYANFAPVVDVNTNPLNPVIGVRSFGDDTQTVSDLASQYAKGLHSAGVAACAKHFPGHGDTSVDSHKALPVILHDRARLDSVEFPPFRRLIAEGVEMVMVGHLSVPALDSTGVPASISKTVYDFVRDSLGFEGVLVTDGMNMKGLTSMFGGSDIPGCVLAYLAGADMIITPIHCHEIINQIVEKVEAGEYPIEEVDKKAYRVLKLKQKLGIIQN